MGRDLRQSRIDYNNRNLIYDGVYVDNYQIKPNAISKGVFYSKDLTPMSYGQNINGAVKYRYKKITIETLDFVELFPDDYVLYCGELYKVLDPVEQEDDEPSKFYSKRARLKTKITISRRL